MPSGRGTIRGTHWNHTTLSTTGENKDNKRILNYIYFSLCVIGGGTVANHYRMPMFATSQGAEATCVGPLAPRHSSLSVLSSWPWGSQRSHPGKRGIRGVRWHKGWREGGGSLMSRGRPQPKAAAQLKFPPMTSSHSSLGG